PAAQQGRPDIRVVDGDAGKQCAAKKIETHIARCLGLGGRSIGHLANKAIPVLPGRVRIQNGGVIQGKELAPRMHGLRESGHLTDREGNRRWVALNWLGGPFTKALKACVPLSWEFGVSEGMMYCPPALAWRIASATGSTWLAVMHPGQPFAEFTRLARSDASRLVSVRPGRVGTPLNAPLRASLIRCP